MNIRQTQLPEGWEIKMLGDLFEITSSKRVFKEEWKTEGVPFYRAREIVKLANNGSVNNELFISEEMFNKYSERYGRPNPNDIMVTGVGTLGICYVVKSDDRFYFKDGNIIWLKSKGKANSRYVEYAFKADFLRKQIDDSVGATVGTYTIIKAKSTKIPIPPLSEQKRIVSILDECFSAIERSKSNAEQNLKNANQLFDSYLQRVLENKGEGWEEKKLGEVVNNIMTGPFGSMLHKSDYVEEGIPVVNPQNLVDGTIVPLSKTMINYDTFKRLEKYALKCGDIIIARRGEMGRCAVVEKENENWLCGTGSFVIKVNSRKIDCYFLNVILSSEAIKKQLEKSSIGATMSNLNQTILSELPIRIPSVDQQQSIVRKLDALRAETQKLEAIYQKKLNDLEELKKSILQKAFAGELSNAKIYESKIKYICV